MYRNIQNKMGLGHLGIDGNKIADILVKEQVYSQEWVNSLICSIP